MSDTNIENEIIEKVMLEGYIKQFDPEIQKIFYHACGSSLDTMPLNLQQSNLSMDRLLEGLLSLNNVKSQKIILMRLGFVTGATMTLQEVAEELGITRERVRQIESMYMRRFPSRARCKKIREFYTDQ